MTAQTKFDTLTLALPAHWLPALVSCDYSGLDDEYGALCRWENDTIAEFGHVSYGLPSGDSEEYFARYHDAAEYGVLACMCHDVLLCFEVS